MSCLSSLVDEALSYPDPAEGNEAITQAHFALSQALNQVLGAGAGANFHSWAVWGSKKAGVTIRQEDLETALRDATVAGGICGGVVALALARRLSGPLWYPLGAILGPLSGALSGRALARWSRRKAARLVLQGNRLVLDDIGRQTARFCQRFAARKTLTSDSLEEFVRSVSPPLLKEAFRQYGLAVLTERQADRCQHTYFANLLAILHEHQKLQPYIAGSMPMVVRRCVTRRLMRFEIGALQLSVSQDVPPLSTLQAFPEPLASLRLPLLREFLARWERAEGLEDSRATDWSRIEHRMAYIVSLFRRFHLDQSVMAAP